MDFMSSSPRNIISFDVVDNRYKLATGAKEDRIFLKSFKFDVCIFDEGHMLKNSMSKQYIELMKLNANFRVLLTGTVFPFPSLLMIASPKQFDRAYFVALFHLANCLYEEQ
jgi:SWI/SNF-related matrix-associated actin-dependent regulator of chromatin subfamily A containing DEAD/H box 1